MYFLSISSFFLLLLAVDFILSTFISPLYVLHPILSNYPRWILLSLKNLSRILRFIILLLIKKQKNAVYSIQTLFRFGKMFFLAVNQSSKTMKTIQSSYLLFRLLTTTCETTGWVLMSKYERILVCFCAYTFQTCPSSLFILLLQSNLSISFYCLGLLPY